MSETPKTTIVSRVRDWISAVVIACQVVTARACSAELTTGEATPLEIEGEVAE